MIIREINAGLLLPGLAKIATPPPVSNNPLQRQYSQSPLFSQPRKHNRESMSMDHAVRCHDSSVRSGCNPGSRLFMTTQARAKSPARMPAQPQIPQGMERCAYRVNPVPFSWHTHFCAIVARPETPLRHRRRVK